jgi:hypothetical protein
MVLLEPARSSSGTTWGGEEAGGRREEGQAAWAADEAHKLIIRMTSLTDHETHRGNATVYSLMIPGPQQDLRLLPVEP